jgi:putative ABC transport system permease protein
MTSRSSIPWFLLMAWRDSRGSRAHLLLSIIAIALGIAALVAIRSFSLQLDGAVERQTRQLLGADISVRALQIFSDEMETYLATLPGEQVREIRFFSMAQFPQSSGTRLSNIRTLSAPYPFYGSFQTEPPDAQARMLAEPGLAIVEDSLLLQYDAVVGDALQLGEATFMVAGRLFNVSGEAPATSTFVGPRIYIAERDVAATGLLGEGSLVRHYAHVKLPDDVSAAQWNHQQRSQLSALRLETETADERRALLGNALRNLYRYLNIGAFSALLLGGIGLAGATQLYVRKKKANVAVLRCLGGSMYASFGIYLWQVAIAAGLGAALGAVLGGVLQYGLPGLLMDFLPVPVEPVWSWSSMGVGFLFGLAMAFVFALYPLMPLRRVSPLEALRSDTNVTRRTMPYWEQSLILTGLMLAILGFALAHTDTLRQGISLTLALVAVFGLLALTARGVMWLARRSMRDQWSFAWRQGIANLHRPYNQTTVLLLGLGLGAFLLATLTFTQDNLVNQFRQADRYDRPNLILFDIQPDQIEPVRKLVGLEGIEYVESSPIVTMRLTEVNGRSVGDLRDDAALAIPHWVLFREYRTTYRRELASEEKVIAGAWQGSATDPSGRIPISIEKGMADYLKVGLHAELTFNLQGVMLHTVVRSIREVDWRQMRTNFFVIFPAGVLEEAPQMWALVSRAPTAAAAAGLQNRVVTVYPNISAVDLRMVVASIDEVLDKAAFVIRFMALFCVFTGLWVLGGTVMTSRYDRLEEVTLLRTMGASRGQLQRIMVAEYALLGSIASVAGLFLGWVAGAASAHWLFDIRFRPSIWPALMLPLAITSATVAVGWITNRGLVR